MKRRVKVEHIPSGKVWIGKWRTDPIISDNNLIDLKDNCTMLIISDDGEVAIPAIIWNASVRTLESNEVSSKAKKEPAFPFTHESEDHSYLFAGMSKRFYTACAAMQGILASVAGTPLLQANKVIKLAYEMADELLKQESDETN